MMDAFEGEGIGAPGRVPAYVVSVRIALYTARGSDEARRRHGLHRGGTAAASIDPGVSAFNKA